MHIVLLDPGGFTPPYDAALTDALAAQGHDVTVLSTRAGIDACHGPVRSHAMFPDSVRTRSGVLRPVRHLALAAKGVRYLVSLERAARLVESLRPDVVHWQWLPLPIADRRIVKRLAAVAPQVMTVHDATLFNGTGSSALQSVGYGTALRAMDRLILHSRYGREQLLSVRDVNRARLHVVPHGAFTHYVGLAAASRTTPARTLVVPGTIKPYKGIPLLLEAFAKLSAEARLGWSIRVVGPPVMDTAPLETLTRTLGIAEQVHFEFRRLSETEFAHEIDSAGIIVLPYTEIDQSGVLMAAMALGRPIIASAIGAIPETIEHQRSGLLVPPRDVGSLSTALAELMHAPELRQRLGEAARVRAERHLSWSAIAVQTTAVYAQAIEQPVFRLQDAAA